MHAQATDHLSNGTPGVKSSSPCLRCASRDLENSLSLPTHDSEGKDILRVEAQKDGLKIEQVNSSKQTASAVIDGPSISVINSKSNGVESSDIVRGQQTLYSLTMEQSLAKDFNYETIDLGRVELFNAPMQQLSELIKNVYWKNLTRRLDMSNSAVSGRDPKDWTDDPRPRVFVPYECQEQYQYYSQIAADHPHLRLDVQLLPETGVTPKIIQGMNDKPGALALEIKQLEHENGQKSLHALPFIVPGGRFDEMYGWDSFFATWGLLRNGYVDICESMVRNFCFSIQHYGKILNANRTYYLGRSQPPFLTSMGLSVFEMMDKNNPKSLEFLRLVVQASVKDYYTTWMAVPRYNAETGLSRYHGDGVGFPPEVEPDHYEEIIAIHAEKHKMKPMEFFDAYNDGRVQDPELDEWLDHDRAGRESGHDTTYRFIERAADLAAVDLNSCLYKYEIDLAHIIKTYFNGKVNIDDTWRAPGHHSTEENEIWTERAAARRKAMDKYLWCADEGMYFDYDTKHHEQMSYEAATTLWPLWAGAASPEQAESLIAHAIPKLECYGGLVSSTQKSRDELGLSHQARQWDYPYGWAPHQMLAWDGLRRYGHHKVAERLAYRWVSMMLKTFRDHNGLVVEKYDVTRKDHNGVAEAEYGNQGSDFSSDLQTGFAWTNASFVYGLEILQAPCETCPAAAVAK